MYDQYIGRILGGKTRAMKLMILRQMADLKPGQKMAILSQKNGLTTIERNPKQIEDKKKC